MFINDIIKKLNTQYIGKNIQYVNSVDSTNDELRRRINGLDEGFTLIAGSQLRGKGRLGRQWISRDSGAVYMSVLLKPRTNICNIPQMTLLCGLAVCNALNKVTNIGACIKWPNDIVAENKKLCGILCESVINGDNDISVIAGIGINVQNREFPQDIKNKAASIYTLSNKMYNKADIICAVLEELEVLYDKFILSPESILEQYKTKCVSLNREIKFTHKNEVISAYAFDIDSTGALKVRDYSGRVYAVSSGEVTVQGIY